MSEEGYDTSGRLDDDLLKRFLDFAVRVVRVAEELAQQGRSRRVVDQMIGCGTGSSANMFEAHEACSRADFIRCLGIVARELSEVRFWLLLVMRMQWLPASRLDPLLDETLQLLSIVKSMIVRSRRRRADKV